MSSEHIPTEQARKVLGDLVAKAQHAGQITILTRYGQDAAGIVPMSLVPQESAMPETEHAPGYPRAYVAWPYVISMREDLASSGRTVTVEQLGKDTPEAYLDRRGELAIVERVDGELVHIVAAESEVPGGRDAIEETARRYAISLVPQETAMASTITLVSANPGDVVDGIEISDPACPVDWSHLPDAAQSWAREHGYGPDSEDELVYVLNRDAQVPEGFPSLTFDR